VTNYTTLGGRIECTQCKAMSKRTRLRCRAPAIKGKAVCRFHGGKSTGARTEAGRAKIAAAHTVHGRETRQKRADTSSSAAEIRYLEALGFTCGMFPVGTPRMRGRKPVGVSKTSNQLKYLAQLVEDERREAILEIIRHRMAS
jgi:hypothetical protein